MASSARSKSAYSSMWLSSAGVAASNSSTTAGAASTYAFRRVRGAVSPEAPASPCCSFTAP